ncbi:MAG: N-acetylmuramoyl-L-alanine amidase [Lachnospiraceae bacterium]|jgi:N-acetylmuramoyl-L-alanine amidase|nr:N-acetylmuramoyl-L-alanine amidase [Lachnospiraceae bacterium]
MSHNERDREMSPAERRRRMEARRRRQKAQEQRRRKKLMLLIGGGAAALVVIGIVIFAVKHFISGGPAAIASKNGSYVIVIDPGHGGEDMGMSNGEAKEKQVTLDICSKLKVMLESQGCQVVMLREDDTRISKEERVQKANEAQADLLVSVHCGYSDNSSISGAVSHYKKGSKESRYLAEMIESALVKESGALDGGSGEGSYSILSDTEMPAVLVEVGYISNMEEAGSLTDDSYQNDAAKGIAKGIIMSLEKNE